MQFLAVDVETANARLGSICRIGIVGFDGGREVFARDILLDPAGPFDPIHVRLHGVEPTTVLGAPTFAAVHGELCERFNDQLVVCHTSFDRTSIAQASTACGMDPPACRWLDSARVARKAWERFAERGYGLANVAQSLGIEFRHHDAVHDARTAGLILLAACKEANCEVTDWPVRVRPLETVQWSRIERDPTGHGDLDGEVVVITGALSVSRATAADLIASAGGEVDPGVTKRTTMVVLGDQDLAMLAGKDKSSKHLRAEKLIAEGQSIRFLAESDLVALLD